MGTHCAAAGSRGDAPHARDAGPAVGVAASTIRNLESGAHQPNPATIARLCEALDLPSPLCGSELRLCLDEVDYPMAVKTLRGALDEYRTVRADPAAFVEARRVSPHDRTGGDARCDRCTRRGTQS